MKMKDTLVRENLNSIFDKNDFLSKPSNQKKNMSGSSS